MRLISGRFLAGMAAAAAALAAVVAPAAAQTQLAVRVIPVGEASLAANIVLVTGESHAALIDAPFTRADALRIAAEVLDSGRTLETVYITHDHPDHFFGVDAIADLFPQARIVARREVAAAIERSYPFKFRRWAAGMGQNAPRRAVVPQPLDADHFMLDGHRLEILGPMQGDHALSTAVWIPEASTLVAGDLVFNNVHLWLGEHLAAQRRAWARSLERLAALNARNVVAGHSKPPRTDDSGAIAWTLAYLRAFEEFARTSRSSGELAQRIRARFPEAIDFGDFILSNSSRVAMRETPPWDE